MSNEPDGIPTTPWANAGVVPHGLETPPPVIAFDHGQASQVAPDAYPEHGPQPSDLEKPQVRKPVALIPAVTEYAAQGIPPAVTAPEMQHTTDRAPRHPQQPQDGAKMPAKALAVPSPGWTSGRPYAANENAYPTSPASRSVEAGNQAR